MSRAGAFANEGFYYQALIATHWLIRLLREPEDISAIQVESMGLPEETRHVNVDDVVVCYRNGSHRFIQAKKNQTDHRAWSISDLKVDLLKAGRQIESWPDSIIEFYSRTPFGDLQKLTEECFRYADYPAFARETPTNQRELLEELASVIESTELSAFTLARRLRFGPSNDYERWEADNRATLAQLIARANIAMPVLEALLTRHQSKLADTKITITREDILSKLAEHGLAPTPFRSETEILDAFRQASTIGRQWPRAIANRVIPTPHPETVLRLVAEGSRTILVQGGPGSGKTCVLLDIAEAIEARRDWALLFIKADLFREAQTETDLSTYGLPDDIVGQCARLSEYRRVVVIIDSLDVLSLSRHHRALRLFLGLLDRLQKLDGITTIAACREFDLKYETLLRNRTWEKLVQLNDLDFENQVAPLLMSIGIAPETLSETQRQLLRKPHLLKLYANLAERGIVSTTNSPYELFELFLDELVIKNLLMGVPAVEALHKMSKDILSARSDGLQRAQFAYQDAIPSLLSLGVLLERSPSRLQFGHQTWGEFLSVRAALAQGQTLTDFIHTHHPLPFIRPSVRAFLFQLRTQPSNVFTRQVRVVLDDDSVAYHLKRLIAESLAEIVPNDTDWSLIRHISDTHSDLFQRLVWRTKNIEWFTFLQERWLPHVLYSAHNEERLWHFLAHLRTWLEKQPAEVIAVWREALAKGWVDTKRLKSQITFALDDLKQWSTQGLRELLETLIEQTDRDFFGRCLGRFIEATNTGDDLLWTWITRGVSDDDISRWNIGRQLHCLPHHFHSKSFLSERMAKSETLLETALAAVSEWSRKAAEHFGNRDLVDMFLSKTSWERSHSNHDTRHVDDLNVLFDAIEQALCSHAAQDSSWWRQHVSDLRLSREVALRYLYLLACQKNLQANLEAVGTTLQDVSLFRNARLRHELGQFMNAAYPLLHEEVWTANQRMLLDLYQHEQETDRESDWAIIATCVSLDWIPACCRLPETQVFIDHHSAKYSPFAREPYIYSSGGWVRPPFSTEILLGLTDAGILQLMAHYLIGPGRTEYEFRGLVGGKEEVLGVLRTAASLDPMRFLSLVPRLRFELADPIFVDHVMEGLANHLRHRTGKLQAPQDWRPLSMPEPATLAKAMLELLERWPTFWKGKRETAEAILACANILLEPRDIECLFFPLFDCLNANDPTEEQVEKNDDLISVAINSTRGRAAEAAFSLCNRLLEAERSLPELLPPILHRFAQDPNPAIRALVLDQLPYTLHKAHDLGWALFTKSFEIPDAHLWSHAERCLYYQYRDHYERVRPWLDRLEREGLEAAGDAWGRLVTLTCLSNQISLENLIQKLQQLDSIEIWQGAAQVFGANLDQRDSRSLCHQGLLTILVNGPCNKEIVDAVERVFLDEASHPYISTDLAIAYLQAIADTDGHCDLHEFLKWLAYTAKENPRDAMEVAETMLTVLEGRQEPCHIWSKETLLPALTAILRESDESDDSEFIRRAIKLQDQLLMLDTYGMDELYDLASNP